MYCDGGVCYGVMYDGVIVPFVDICGAVIPKDSSLHSAEYV